MVTWRHTSLYLFYNKSCLLDFHSMTLRTPGCIIRTPSLPPSVSVWQGWVGEIPTTPPPPSPQQKKSGLNFRKFHVPNAERHIPVTHMRSKPPRDWLLYWKEGYRDNNFVKWKGTFPSERPDRAKRTTLKGGPKSLTGQSNRCFVQGRVVQSWVKITQG